MNVTNMIVLCGALLTSAEGYACKLTQPGYSNVLISAALQDFVKKASSDTTVTQIVMRNSGYVDVRSSNGVSNFRTVYKVDVNADCSTKITTVKVPENLED